ncbi:MAG: hypothetical protein ACRYFU_02105 [Janthinobacterium lividum]
MPASDAAGLLRLVSSFQEPFHGFGFAGFMGGNCAKVMQVAKTIIAEDKTVIDFSFIGISFL